jgi:hypothetical protein
MANNPVPDQGNDFINSGMTLITDPKSDKYLNMVRKHRNDPPKDRSSRWCGGKNGFDDYVERM